MEKKYDTLKLSQKEKNQFECQTLETKCFDFTVDTERLNKKKKKGKEKIKVYIYNKNYFYSKGRRMDDRKKYIYISSCRYIFKWDYIFLYTFYIMLYDTYYWNT